LSPIEREYAVCPLPSNDGYWGIDSRENVFKISIPTNLKY